MTVLLWLTLAYAAVLVIALAAGLIAVWLRLRGIDRALDAARRSLVATRDATTGLDDGIRPLNDRLMATVESLEASAADLTAAEEHVRERLGAAPAGSVE